MTIWQADLSRVSGPLYLGIADALGRDIESGVLPEGTRLPTHRDLAEALGVTVGTVSRAYAEAERRGLVKGEVGRGTFVRGGRPSDTAFAASAAKDDGMIQMDLSVPGVPIHPEQERELRAAFRRLCASPHLNSLLESRTIAGSERHRRAFAEWARRWGLSADPDRILICCGAQHGLTAAISSLTKPGDAVFVENLTYPGMRAVAGLLHLRLHGLPMDEHGLIPEAFERACRKGAAKVLYCIPTLQNPTLSVMTEERRRRIAEIAMEWEIALVEDEAYAFLEERRPRPICSWMPELGYHLLSVSKIIAPGLRVGALTVPKGAAERASTALWATTWVAPTPLVDVVAEWIERDDLERFAQWQREELSIRNRLAQEAFEGFRQRGHRCGPHLWLELPETWRSDEFVLHSRRKGVAVASSESFTAGATVAPRAVRLSLGAERNRKRLQTGLGIIAEMLNERSQPPLCLA